MQLSSDIRSLSISNLEKILLKENFEKYRASQIFDWLNKGNVRSFEEMKNLYKSPEDSYCNINVQRSAISFGLL